MSRTTIIQAKTFTCQYVTKEDRLLFTINYKDVVNRIDYWITRSFLIKLLPYFFDYSVSIASSEEQIPSKSATPTDPSTFLLTQKEPMLLESVDFTKNNDDKMVITFRNRKKNVSCKAFLDNNSFSALARLIIKSAPAFEWGVYKI